MKKMVKDLCMDWVLKFTGIGKFNADQKRQKKLCILVLLSIHESMKHKASFIGTKSSFLQWFRKEKNTKQHSEIIETGINKLYLQKLW